MKWMFSNHTKDLPSEANIRMLEALLSAGVQQEIALQVAADMMAIDVRANWIRSMLVYNTVLLGMLTFDIVILVIRQLLGTH
jgi:hypothetical protein